MSAPRWARRLLVRLAPPDREEELVGDLEEAHRDRVTRLGRFIALVLTGIEAMDIAVTLRRERRGQSVVSRSRKGLAFSWLDIKLGIRMLVKYPGLTFLGGLSMSFAIFVGAAAFELFSQVVMPSIPLDEGDRLVDVRLQNLATGRIERRALYDASLWSEQLRNVEELTVYRNRDRNLVTADGMGEPVLVAEMGSAGFHLSRAAPLLGRVLTPADDGPDAPPVVVIGHDLWTRRFGADPELVGQDIRLDDTPTTVVGVMPEGFGFPHAHQMWMALGPDMIAYEPVTGPPVAVLGRLAPGATLQAAQAELSAHGRRMRESHATTHEQLTATIIPLGRSIMSLPASMPGALVTVVGLTSNLPLLLFVMLVCGNVGLLMFARATSRDGELVVRNALGASRSRIVAQLFVEALVLAGVAAFVGVLAAGGGLRWALQIVQETFNEGQPLPFWIQARISPETILYAALLAVVAALVAGAWPGLRVTRSLGAGLRARGAGGGGFRFGGIWTAVIATQIVVTMLFPVVTLLVRSEGSGELDYTPSFRLEEFAVAQLEATRPTPDDSAGPPNPSVALRLEERLLAEPGVSAVTAAERLPMTYHPWNAIEIDGPSEVPFNDVSHRAGSARVDIDFFEVMGAEIVQGRGFRLADLEQGARAVVVDDAFVDRVLGGRNAIGVRLRYLANESNRDPAQEPGPWVEIVGVVREIGARCFCGPGGIYHPVQADDLEAPYLLAHLPAGAESFPPRIRALAVEVDPTLRLRNVETLVEATSGPRTFYAFWTTILVAVSGIAMLLSLGGIYAVWSYTAAQRTREIGIRVALGASSSRTIAAVFRRPLIQVGTGLGVGFLLLALPVAAPPLLGASDLAGGAQLRLFAGLIGYCVVVALVCLTACAAPTLRALRVQPMEALRVDG